MLRLLVFPDFLRHLAADGAQLLRDERGCFLLLAGQLRVRVQIFVDGEERRHLGVRESLRCLLRAEWRGGETEDDREQADLHSARIPERCPKHRAIRPAERGPVSSRGAQTPRDLAVARNAFSKVITCDAGVDHPLSRERFRCGRRPKITRKPGFQFARSLAVFAIRDDKSSQLLDSTRHRRVVAGPWLSRKTRSSSAPIRRRASSRSSSATPGPCKVYRREKDGSTTTDVEPFHPFVWCDSDVTDLNIDAEKLAGDLRYGWRDQRQQLEGADRAAQWTEERRPQLLRA